MTAEGKCVDCGVITSCYLGGAWRCPKCLGLDDLDSKTLRACAEQQGDRLPGETRQQWRRRMRGGRP